MPAVLTYDNLVQTVTDYVQRTDATFLGQIPVFVLLGERRVARDLKILGTKVTISGTLIPNNPAIQKPARWLNDSSMNIGTNVGTATGFNTRVNVLQRAYEYCLIYWPDATQVGTPKYYASDRDYYTWMFFPTPDVAYPYQALYYEIPILIDENFEQNWLTVNAPEVLIYGTLLETATYLQDDQRAPLWKEMYENAKKLLTDEDMRRIYDGFSKRGG